MTKFYRRGLRQILFAVCYGIFIAVMVFGCVILAVKIYNEQQLLYILGLLCALLISAVLLYFFVCLFRSYITFSNYEISVTANVRKNSRFVYKDQNAFTLRYDKIAGIYLDVNTPNPATYMKYTPKFTTLVLQTVGNNRYITLAYYSDKQICRIIDLLNDKAESSTGNRLTDKSGAEMLAEFKSANRKKR